MSEFQDNSECSIHVRGSSCLPVSIKNKIEPIEVLKEKTGCTTELCVMKSDHIYNKLGPDIVYKIIKEYYKPIGPKFDVTKWLSNDDIDDTLEQWARTFPHFYHIPFQMRDFEQTNTELAVIDIPTQIKQNYKTFGCVLNTDWSSGRGKHWFALFFDFRNEPYTLEYFNSSGECPLPEYNTWLNKKEKQLQNVLQKPVSKIIVTRIQNQYDNSSCGCYSLYYIYSRLNNIPWTWFRDNRVPDEKMHEFRKFLFNPE